MTACVRCGQPADIGALCRAHAKGITKASDITAEQIASTVDGQATAWLIDQWGAPHGLVSGTVVGRDRTACGLGIIHHSVSARHAQLDLRDDGWHLTDRGSLNGTFVNGSRVREASVSGGDQVGFGNVWLLFSTTPVAVSDDGGPNIGRTVKTPSQQLAFAATLADGDMEVELAQRVAGGIVRIGGTAIELARLEFALVRELVERRMAQGDPDLAFVSSQELSQALDFKSREADSENVRELVRRVRRKLKAGNITDIIDSRQGVGYRIAWSVRI